jgi:hypothetical protein
MAWTTPRDWTAGELVTEAIMDTHVRDNLKTLEHLIARKTADESLASNTTLQNDDHLLAALAANEKWLMRWVVIHSGGATGAPNIKIAFTVPSGCTFNLSTVTFNAGGTAASRRWNVSGTSSDLLSPASSNPEVTVIEGRVHNGGTAGNIQLQWAQNTSSAENETVYESSSVWGMLV